MRTEIFTQVVQTERVSQTSRSVYLYGVSLRNAESYLLNQQKIFLKNNFRNQSEKIRWDSCVNGARLFTRNMQSTQPFQLKKVIQRIYNKLIMIRTSFLANFKLTFWNKHSLTVVYGAVGLITKALLLRHQIKEQRIQEVTSQLCCKSWSCRRFRAISSPDNRGFVPSLQTKFLFHVLVIKAATFRKGRGINTRVRSWSSVDSLIRAL